VKGRRLRFISSEVGYPFEDLEKKKWKECLKIAKLLKKLQESFDFTGREA